ncbi:MAG: DNA polymerase-2 [Candidatus Endobugula sp.]|jgi:DNA polymerase-2
MKGFILTRHWRDTPEGVLIELWLSTDDGAVQCIIPCQRSVFFIRQSDADNHNNLLIKCSSAYASVQVKPLPLNNVYGEPVAAVYCLQQRQARALVSRLRDLDVTCWEADIRPPERFLMERFITSDIELFNFTRHKKTPSLYQTVTTRQCRPALHLPTPLIELSLDLSRKQSVESSPNPSPNLSMVSLDIETSMDARELYSIAVYSELDNKVFMVDVPAKPSPSALNENGIKIVWCENPRNCLQRFLGWLTTNDPDIIIGWHVVQFDCWVLTKLCERWDVPFTLGRAKQIPHWRVEGDSDKTDSSKAGNSKVGDTNGSPDRSSNNSWIDRRRRHISVPGRVVLDGIELLRTAFYHFDSFSLQFVAKQILGEGKLIDHNDRGQAISDLFLSNDNDDRITLAKYNLQDCILVWNIFKKTKLLQFAIARSRLTGMPLDKMGGSVASFDYAYLPKLHRNGYIAPNLGELTSAVISPGGYVMESLPGLYRHVLVLDFKSLYPSIIRTFAIDPCGFWYADHQKLPENEVINGFNGAFFSRDQHILPGLINTLWQARDQAKANKDKPLSQAIKIIMNSFYGVLGSRGCRFFDPRVCSSITLRGHEIIQKSHGRIEAQGYQVIYGDTDSLFVWLGQDFSRRYVDAHSANEAANIIGKQLSVDLNQWWQRLLHDELSIESQLEIEFETHYHDFLMPTIRNSEKGSKKRYAGRTMQDGEKQLIFKGLEAVRTDWTPLAKRFQTTLYQKIFDTQPYRQYIMATVEAVKSSAFDDELIYKKRLRSDVSHYQKSIPPHVKAARKHELANGQALYKGDTIAYVITVNGPEPIGYVSSQIDYQHYIDKQIKPIANSILVFLDDDFNRIIDSQMCLI